MKKAFTLLELLVVIGIISVLVAMGTTSYSTSQKKARDAKREGDLGAFQKAMEQCYSVNSFQYPAITGNGTRSISENCAATTGPDMTITEPITSGTFRAITSGSNYSVTVKLESISTGTFTIVNQQ
jgi:type IV pilus assembly protein PilE